MMLRFHTQTGGVTLTAQQPQNNVVRVALQAFAAVCGGTQSLHTNGYDEALALPTERAAKIALRTQQIIAHESGATDTVDPFAGSYYVESLTAEIERRAWKLIEQRRRAGRLGQRDRVHQERDRGVGLRLPRALPHRAGRRRRREPLRRGGRRGRGHPARRPRDRARPDRAPEGVQGRPRPGARRRAARGAARGRPRRRQPAAADPRGARGPRARWARYAARCATCSGSISPRSELFGRLLLALALLLAVPASAQAAFEVRSFSVTPTALQAGSHPTSASRSASRRTDVGQPAASTSATSDQPAARAGRQPERDAALQPGAVPGRRLRRRTTRVGTTSVKTTIPALITGITVDATGDVYNLAPGAGEPARLGVVVRPPLGADKVFLVTRSRCGRATAAWTRSSRTSRRRSAPAARRAGHVDRVDEPDAARPPAGASQPFMTMPTGCGPATAQRRRAPASGTQP